MSLTPKQRKYLEKRLQDERARALTLLNGIVAHLDRLDLLDLGSRRGGDDEKGAEDGERDRGRSHA